VQSSNFSKRANIGNFRLPFPLGDLFSTTTQKKKKKKKKNTQKNNKTKTTNKKQTRPTND